MNENKRRLLTANFALWIIGALLHPASHLLPTSTGEPPKIMSLLIPIMILILAGSSTAMIAKAINGNAEQTKP